VLAAPTLTTYNVSKHFTSPRTWTDSWERRKRWKRDTRFGTWNVQSLNRAGYPTTVARGLVRFRLDLVCVQEVGWEKRETVLADD
jgi:hypothetical protein